MTTKRIPAPARLTFAQIRDRIQRPQRIVELILDAEAAAEIEALDDLLGRLTRPGVDRADEVRQVAQRLDAAEQAAEASRVPFTLQAVSHRTYQELRAAHPVTREQADEAKRLGNAEPAFDADTFTPALVHAQLTEPRPTDAAEFDAFWAELSDGQLSRLAGAAFAVQLYSTDPEPRNHTAVTTLRAAASK